MDGFDAQHVRRQRLLAVSALAVAAAAVFAVLLAQGGNRHHSARTTAKTTSAAKRPATRRPSGPKVVPASAPGAHRAPNEPVPILMYHVINPPPASAPFPELYVRPADFQGQMNMLKSQGYHAVTLGQVYRAWKQGGLLPSRPVVVSFDDGYRGIYRNALPTLRKLGWVGTLNLELRVMSQPDQGGLAPSMVRALVAAGWELDSHTIDHPDLTTVSPAQLSFELVQSRKRLQRQFGVPASFFCYPAGRYNAQVVAAVRAAGYLAATTTKYGFATPSSLYELNRVRVNGSDGVSGLQSKLSALRAGSASGVGVNQGEGSGL